MTSSIDTSSPISESSFRHIVGQKSACEILASALRAGRVPHAYLFVGPEGVGKRTTAVQWAKILNCISLRSEVEACEECVNCRRIAAGSHPDVMWVNFEYQARLLKEPVEKQRALKIDTVREMERLLHMKALEGRAKIAFLEPAELLTEQSAHALLKILEEPPAETHLVLLAKDPSQLLATIRSRCQWVRFGPITADILLKRLMEKGGDRLPEEEARRIAVQAEGSLGRALSLAETGEELRFDWENAPLTEFLPWTEGFGASAEGRQAAEDFLHRILTQERLDLYEGRGSEESIRRTLDALRQIRQNVTPSLVLQVILLRMRWEKRTER